MSDIVLIDGVASEVIDFAAEYLRQAGHSVTVPHDGPELLALCCDNEPDIVAMPVMVPRSDAFSVLGKLREAGRCERTKFLLICPLGPLGEPERAWDYNIHACLPRPYTKWHLILGVEQLIYREVVIRAKPK